MHEHNTKSWYIFSDVFLLLLMYREVLVRLTSAVSRISLALLAVMLALHFKVLANMCDLRCSGVLFGENHAHN